MGNLYDLVYQIYCAKLSVEGQDFDMEKSLRAFLDRERIDRLKDSQFGTKSKKSKSSGGKGNDD